MQDAHIDFGKLMNLNSEEAFKRLFLLKEKLEQIMFLVEEIEEEKDREVVDVYLDLLAIAKREVDAVIECRDPNTVRELVRNGVGDYGRIQKKCIKMGLV